MRGKAPTTVRVAPAKTSSPSFRRQHSISVEGARHRVEAARADGYAVALACDPTLEGVLGSIGIGYLAHVDEAHVRLLPRDGCQQRFGEQVVDMPSDASDDLVTLARRVYLGVERHVVQDCPKARQGNCPTNCAGACARRLVYATASDAPTMPEAVHRYVRMAFTEGPRMRGLIAEERVVEVDELARYVLGECEHTKQFARFSLLADGSLFAAFRPRADTIPLTAGYFAARMGGERFCIVDPVHRSAAFHDSGKLGGRKGYAIVKLDEESAEQLMRSKDLSPDEPYVRALWKRFYDAVTLPGRDVSQRGYDLRAGWMPKRFWGGLTELDPRAEQAPSTIPERYHKTLK